MHKWKFVHSYRKFCTHRPIIKCKTRVWTVVKFEGKSDISVRNSRIGSLQASSKTNTKARITPTINPLIKFCILVQKKTFIKKWGLFLEVVLFTSNPVTTRPTAKFVSWNYRQRPLKRNLYSSLYTLSEVTLEHHWKAKKREKDKKPLNSVRRDVIVVCNERWF